MEAHSVGGDQKSTVRGHSMSEGCCAGYGQSHGEDKQA